MVPLLAEFEVDYDCPSVSFQDFKFDAPLPVPFKISTFHKRSTKLVIPPALASSFQVAPPSTPHHKNGEAVERLLKNRKSGTSEDSLHGRDDAFLYVSVTVLVRTVGMCPLLLSSNALCRRTFMLNRHQRLSVG
jgi:hypothetical protein